MVYTDQATIARGIAAGGMPLGHVTSEAQGEAIEDASRLADSYFARRYTMPLVAVGRDVYLRVGDIAIWYLLRGRTEGSVEVIRLAYEDAIRWLEQVAAGKVDPDITDSSSGAVAQPSAPRARVRSASSRGFDTISDSATSAADSPDGWPVD